MFDALTEGIRSIGQVCHLVILAPVAMTIVAARGRIHAFAGAMIGVVLGGWIFVSGWIDVTDIRLRISAVPVIGGLGMIAVVLNRHNADADPSDDPAGSRNAPSQWIAGGVTAAIAAVVTHWWRPCVGVELGSILTEAPGDPWGQLPATVGFMLGVSVPLIAIGLVYAAWQPSRTWSSRLSYVGIGLGAVLAMSVVAGQHGEIVSRLFQWSQ